MSEGKWRQVDGITRLFIQKDKQSIFDIPFEFFDTEEEAKETAKYIVNALNSHDQLVEALKASKATHERAKRYTHEGWSADGWQPTDVPAQVDVTINEIDAALKAAGVEVQP